MTKRFRFAPLILAVMVTGCVTLTPEQQAVRVTSNPETVRGCDYKGPASTLDKALPSGTYHSLVDILKVRTHQLHGNVVLISALDRNVGYGEAYECKNKSQETSEAK